MAFFKVINLLLVHAPGADRPDSAFTFQRPNGEGYQDVLPRPSLADGKKARLSPRMRHVGADHDRTGEQTCDILDGNHVLLAFLQLALVPIETRKQIHKRILHIRVVNLSHQCQERSKSRRTGASGELLCPSPMCPFFGGLM
jgi:hypothetical protein